MSKKYKPKHESRGQLNPDDLISLVVKPLSGRIDQVWQNLFEKLQGIEAMLEIIARQTARQIPDKEQDMRR